jgi:hypothetical protein
MPASLSDSVSEPIAQNVSNAPMVQTTKYTSEYVFTRWIKHTAPIEDLRGAHSITPQIIGEDPHLVVELAGIIVASSPGHVMRHLFNASVKRYDRYEDVHD